MSIYHKTGAYVGGRKLPPAENQAPYTHYQDNTPMVFPGEQILYLYHYFGVLSLLWQGIGSKHSIKLTVKIIICIAVHQMEISKV